MVDSTTLNFCLLAGVGVWEPRRRAIVAKTREFVIAVLPFWNRVEGKGITLLRGRLLAGEGVSRVIAADEVGMKEITRARVDL